MNHAVEAVGWTLVNFCWQAAIIAEVYRVLDWLCSRCSNQNHYLLSLSALLLMGASAAATMVYEVIRVSSSFSVQTGAASSPTGILALQPLQESTIPSHSVLGPLSTLIAGSQSLLPWVDLVWLLGVAYFSIRTITGWHTLESLRSEKLGQPSGLILESFSRICGLMRLKKVNLHISERVGGPLTMGILHPLILMPASAVLGLSQEQLEVVLAHELAHVERMDYLWNLIQTAVETLFFFHPSVWWLGRRLRHQRELCCDDLALKICSDRHTYAMALLHLEELRRRRTSLAMALTGNHSPSNLRERIALILGQKLPARHGRSNRLLSIAVLSIALGLFVVPLPKVLGKRIATEMQGPSELHALLTANSPQVRDYDFTTPSRPSSTSTRYESGRVTYGIGPNAYSSSTARGVPSEHVRKVAHLGSDQQAPNEPTSTGAPYLPPGYAASLRAVGIIPANTQQLITLHMFGVTSAFIKGMKAAGFDSITPDQAIHLRILGVTNSYAVSIKGQLPAATVHDVIELRVMQVDGSYIALMKRDGIRPLTVNKLIKLHVLGYDQPANRGHGTKD